MSDRAQQEAARIRDVRRIFRERHKLLAALFPENGETLVARACAVACSLVNSEQIRGASVVGVCERVIASHHLGLEIGDHAYLVSYGGDVQLIIGPRGLIALAYRSGMVKSIYATSVFHADVEQGLFKYNLATREVHHEKAPTGRRVGPDGKGARPEQLIDYAYCVIETSTGGTVLEVLTREDIAFYRSFSKAKSEKSPWYTNYEGMCRKTALKRGLEFVPRSPLLAAALRETETGGYEIPEEMWQRARLIAAGVNPEDAEAPLGYGDADGLGAPEHVPAAAREPAGYGGHRAAEPREREPGEEG